MSENVPVVRRPQASFSGNENIALTPFQPLSNEPTSFRLLKVTGRDKAGFINCILRESFIGREDYVALSYVCGIEHASYRISLDGKPCWVRPSLYQFLLHTLEDLPNVDLRIDALCTYSNRAVMKHFRFLRFAPCVEMRLMYPLASQKGVGAPRAIG